MNAASSEVYLTFLFNLVTVLYVKKPIENITDGQALFWAHLFSCVALFFCFGGGRV